jgi:16S rRNA (uracil1498-N3)-methyltransferase
MTRRRWIADEVHENTAALIGEHAAHLSRVLRAQVGQEFDIAIPGAVRSGKITSISHNRVDFALGRELPAKPSPKLTLLLAVFKFDRMEWAIEKCTEIGATRIVPLIARRTDAHLAAAAVKRHERWQRIAQQSSEQSRRAAPPKVDAPVKFKDLGKAGLTSDATANTSVKRIVLAETESDVRLRDILAPQSSSTATEIMLAVGPEGGWADDEFAWFRGSRWQAASLGETILRAETAAIVAAAIVLDALR